MTRRVKANVRDVVELRTLLVDVDPVDGKPLVDYLPVTDVLDLLGVPIRACSILHSGRGLHVWVSFTPTLLSEQGRDVWGRRLDGFIHEVERRLRGYPFKLDTSTSDLCRVARLPGTVNQRSGRMAEAVLWAKEAVSPEVLAPFELKRPEQNVFRPLEGRENIESLDLLPHLNRVSEEFLEGRVERGSRHEACYATVKRLHEIGCPEEVAADIVYHAAVLNGIDELGFVQRTVRSVFNGG